LEEQDERLDRRAEGRGLDLTQSNMEGPSFCALWGARRILGFSAQDMEAIGESGAPQKKVM
jgi:hypothetical protein